MHVVATLNATVNSNNTLSGGHVSHVGQVIRTDVYTPPTQTELYYLRSSLIRIFLRLSAPSRLTRPTPKRSPSTVPTPSSQRKPILWIPSFNMFSSATTSRREFLPGFPLVSTPHRITPPLPHRPGLTMVVLPIPTVSAGGPLHLAETAPFLLTAPLPPPVLVLRPRLRRRRRLPARTVYQPSLDCSLSCGRCKSEYRNYI